MTNREQCLNIINSFTETQLANVVEMLQAMSNSIREDADDAYCAALYKEYEQSPDKGQPVSIEEAAGLLGVTL